jgi:hypothetical protein
VRVTIGIAFATLVVGAIGNYLQWRQLDVAVQSMQQQLSGTPASSRDSLPTHSGERTVADLSIWPFALTSVSSLVLLGLLVFICKRHSQSIEVRTGHHRKLEETATSLNSLRTQHLTEIEKTTRLLQELETRLSTANQERSAMGIRINTVENASQDAKAKLLMHQGSINDLYEARDKSKAFTTELDNKVEGCKQRLDEHRPWISDLEEALAAVRSMVQGFPNHAIRQMELTELIQGLRLCFGQYLELRALYPDHPAATLPFATGWRPSRPDQELDEITRRYEQWARRLGDEVERAKGFQSKWRVSLPSTPLLPWVSTWCVNRHDTEASDLIRAMAEYSDSLANTRGDYAATAAKLPGSETIS